MMHEGVGPGIVVGRQRAKLSIVIPVFNEVRTIRDVVERVRAVDLPSGVTKEVLIVDDGSTDGTAALLHLWSSDPSIRVLTLSARHGKSEAVRVGVAVATGDIVVLQDADLEYDPSHLAQLLQPILEGRASVVFGSRFRGRIRRMVPLIWLANRWSSWTVNLLFGAQLTDVNTGYKMMRRDLLHSVQVRSHHFGYEAELTAKLLRRGHHISEVPIQYTARTRREGKKMNWRAALHMYLCFIWYRFAQDGSPQDTEK